MDVYPKAAMKCILQQGLVWGKRKVFEFPCPSPDRWRSC